MERTVTTFSQAMICKILDKINLAHLPSVRIIGWSIMENIDENVTRIRCAFSRIVELNQIALSISAFVVKLFSIYQIGMISLFSVRFIYENIHQITSS